MVSFSLMALENPRNSKDRITPELPRAPRSRAEAVAPAAWPTVSQCFLRISAAAAPMVRVMLVPVSPSGTGNTFRSLMDCFWALMAA